MNQSLDPFSKRIRRFIEWDRYCELQNELSQSSLISQQNFNEMNLESRIKQLEDFETQFGFVYFGEKQWLQKIRSGDVCSYSDWALTAFEDAVFKSPFTKRDWKGLGNCWANQTYDIIGWYSGHSELAKASLSISRLSLCLIPENENEVNPSPQQIVQAFGIIHNLCYHLHSFVQTASKNSKPIILDEGSLHFVSVGPSIGKWYLNYVHEYGVGQGAKFLDQELVEHGPNWERSS